jgi:internalin A
MNEDVARSAIMAAAAERQEELALVGWGLETLPPEIGLLAHLRRLDLRANDLSTVPPEVASLQALIELNLAENFLRALPPALGRLTALQHLWLEGNPLDEVPPEVLAQGTKALLAYLRDQEAATRKWVSKLLVVGEGGVGKTRLLRRLRGEEAPADEPTTRGMDIRPLMMPHPEDPNVLMQLNCWDFGGQQIYHATHQFFLTNRSLFLLVWNARTGWEQGRLTYWLAQIHAKAPDSPVILVATHIDERDAPLPLADLKLRYPQVGDSREVSNVTGCGIEQLRCAIAQQAAHLPLMGELWPTSWLNAANAIRQTKKTLLEPKELEGVYTLHGVHGSSRTVLTRWLHELGDILRFENSAELSDKVFLDPQWVDAVICRVLDSEAVAAAHGVLTRDHMDKLWGDIPAALRWSFVRLMEQFDLSYRTLEDSEISLVVERLPLDPAPYEARWSAITEDPSCHEIAMKYYLDTVPAGIPTWFIARSHRFSTNTHWRYGALLADDRPSEHLGLMRTHYDKKCVELTVRGPQPHNFFAILRDGLEHTLRRFPGLGIRRMVPCRHEGGGGCTHEFNYEDLERATLWRPPVLHLQCPVSFQNASVGELLFGIHWSTHAQVLATVERLCKEHEERARQAQELGKVRADAGMLSRMDTLVEQMNTLVSRIGTLSELVQRDFLKLFVALQSSVDSHVPNVFTLTPVGGEWLDGIAGQEVQLQLFCQAPGHWHPLESGRYRFRVPPHWIDGVVPYLKVVVSVLKHTMPLIAPGVGMLGVEVVGRLQHEFKMMEELAKLFPAVKVSARDEAARSIEDAGTANRVHGAALRALRRLLEELDPGQKWGGLQKVMTPEGHCLWVCAAHAAGVAGPCVR